MKCPWFAVSPSVWGWLWMLQPVTIHTLPRTNNNLLQLTWVLIVVGIFIKYTVQTLNAQLWERFTDHQRVFWFESAHWVTCQLCVWYPLVIQLGNPCLLISSLLFSKSEGVLLFIFYFWGESEFRCPGGGGGGYMYVFWWLVKPLWWVFNVWTVNFINLYSYNY